MVKHASEKAWTRKLWVSDLRTNKDYTLKTNPLGRGPSRGENENGAFFRLGTTNQSPWRATTGGTRRGKSYQEAEVGA